MHILFDITFRKSCIGTSEIKDSFVYKFTLRNWKLQTFSIRTIYSPMFLSDKFLTTKRIKKMGRG